MVRTPARKAGVLDRGALLGARDGLSAGGRWIRTISTAARKPAIFGAHPGTPCLSEQFVPDRPLEEAGFEPSVPASAVNPSASNGPFGHQGWCGLIE